MTAALSWIAIASLWALGLLLALLVAALATPVRLSLALRTEPRWRLAVAMRLFGGLTPSIPVHDSDRRERRRARKTRAVKRRRRKTAGRRSAARMRRVLEAGPRLFRDLLRPIRVERLSLDADLGLSDPADTGMLFGLLQALIRSMPARRVISVSVRPDFGGPRFAGVAEAELRLTPLALVAPGVRFAWRVFGPRP